MIILHSQQGEFTAFRQNRLIKVNFFISLFFNLASWLICFWLTAGWPQSLPLHYNIYFGIDWLGEWYQLFLMPGFGLLVIIFNFGLSWWYFSEQKIISYFAAGISSLVSVLILLATLAIGFINW